VRWWVHGKCTVAAVILLQANTIKVGHMSWYRLHVTDAVKRNRGTKNGPASKVVDRTQRVMVMVSQNNGYDVKEQRLRC
jgi:hypothetical protein